MKPVDWEKMDRRELAVRGVVREELLLLRMRYEREHDLQALSSAFDLWRHLGPVHFPGDPWPAWLLDRVGRELDTSACEQHYGPNPRPRGRHAKPITRRLALRRDAERAATVKHLLARGLSGRKAYREAAALLSGSDAAGTWKVMQQSYQRHAKRGK